MKNLDIKLVGWLKLAPTFPAPVAAHEKLLAALSDIKADLEGTNKPLWLDDLAQLLTTPDEALPEGWWKQIGEIDAKGCSKTAALIAKLSLPLIAKLPIEKIAHKLPDSGSVEAWRKKADISSDDLCDYYLSTTTETLGGVGIHWLLDNIGPNKLAPLFRLLLEQLTHSTHKPAVSEVLLDYLETDSRGKHLEGVLASIGEDAQLLKTLVRVLRSRPAIRILVLDSIGAVAQSKHPRLPLNAFVGLLFEENSSTSAASRSAFCGELARLLSGLLLAPNLSEAGKGAMEKISEITDSLRNTTRDAKLLHSTWALEHLGRPSAESGTYLTPDGARRWALAYEEITRAGGDIGAFEALGFNLGLRKIAEPGKPLVFAPLMHEDITSGLLPDDTAMAVTSGWQFNQRPIIRARVKKVD